MSTEADQDGAGRTGAAADEEMLLTLREPAHRVDRKSIAWWTWQGAITVLVVLAAVGGVSAWLWSVLPDALNYAVLTVAVLLSLAYLVVMPRWKYAVHRWEATGEAVYTAAGWVWQEWRIAPMSRIQTVDMARGPLQQMLGLATVVVTTASAAGPVKIHGLAQDAARELVDHLTATTQATQAADGDAT